MAEQVVRIEGSVPVVTGTVLVASASTLKTNEFDGTTSVHTAGTVVQPTAGQVICTITPPAGFYKVQVNRAADGSGTPLLYNNGSFNVGASSNVMVSVPELGLLYDYEFYVNLNGSTALSVSSVTAASPNITITASITATRMN